eukprot:1534156-Pyramimonas_sp.AAC.1
MRATRIRKTQSLKFECALEWGPECSPPPGGTPHGVDVLKRSAVRRGRLSPSIEISETTFAVDVLLNRENLSEDQV